MFISLRKHLFCRSTAAIKTSQSFKKSGVFSNAEKARGEIYFHSPPYNAIISCFGK
jgi:hypothetical protein